MSPAPPTLWVDVDDLIFYLAHHSRPSGIQRVTFEICQAMHRLDDDSGRVRFVRRRAGPCDIITVAWPLVATAFQALADTTPEAVTPPPPPSRHPPRSAIAAGDASPRQLLTAGLAAQGQAIAALAGLPFSVAATATSALQRRSYARRAAQAARARDQAKSMAALAMQTGAKLEAAAAPGDSLLVLGSPWSRRDYAQTVRWVRDDLRMRFALLIHDLIPLRHPEWCDREVVRSFVDWHRAVLPLADQIFSNSRATAADVTRWARESTIPLPRPVQPVPMGTGLAPHVAAMPDPAPHLPAPGSYALFVSTLEARKNHALLFRAWRRLLSELPRDAVPTLVFAGRIGWLVQDLMQQLENAAWLGGKIRLIRDPTDAELSALYRGCQFTLFPSLFEGWGLPISESLALGRPCVASNRASLPEAGGELVRYFDPESLDDTCRVIRAVIEDPQDLAAWRAQVAREFRPVSWAASADVIRAALDALEPALEAGA